MTENIVVNFVEELDKLIQEANDRKVSADDGEKARSWAIVRTDLQKISAFVNKYLSEEE